MSKIVFRKGEGRQIEFAGVDGVAVTSGLDRPSGDVAILTVRGAHGGVFDRVSDRFYVVTEGSGTFVVSGRDYSVAVDDVVVIPANTPYDFSGEMKVVVFCSPPFDPKNEGTIEM